MSYLKYSRKIEKLTLWQGLSAFDNIDFFGIFSTYLYYAMRLKTNCIKLQRMENRTQKNHPSLFFRKRRAELLDLTAELVIRYWNDIQAQSNREANE